MRAPICVGIFLVTVLSFVPAAGAQQPTESAKKERAPGKGDSVRVRGCLTGPTLESIETTMVDGTGQVASAFTYQLKGDKKLVRQMRDEHDGKVVIVVGTLKSELPQEGGIQGKTLGKTKVTFGVGTTASQRGGVDSARALPVLELKSYEGYGARCSR
jgi:hypothetical protein